MWFNYGAGFWEPPLLVWGCLQDAGGVADETLGDLPGFWEGCLCRESELRVLIADEGVPSGAPLEAMFSSVFRSHSLC